MDYKHIRCAQQGKIWILTINRPEQTNKLSIQTMNELVCALKEAEGDEDCRVVILTGEGEYFCNGGELGDYQRQSSMRLETLGRAL